MKRLLALLILSAPLLHAQNRFPPINLYAGDPTGAPCTIPFSVVQSQTTGAFYSCISNVYVQSGFGSFLPLAGGTLTGPIGFNNGLSAGGTSANIGNVLDCRAAKYAGGVTGDGITDDGPALQACATACGQTNSTSAFAWLPKGTFATSFTVRMPSEVVVAGVAVEHGCTLMGQREHAGSFGTPIGGSVIKWIGSATQGSANCDTTECPAAAGYMAGARWRATKQASILATLTAPVTNGTFTISIDGVSKNITGLDFTGAASLTVVAATIQTALNSAVNGTTCIWSFDRFIITSPTTGASSAISYATATGSGTDISTLLGLRSGNVGSYIESSYTRAGTAAGVYPAPVGIDMWRSAQNHLDGIAIDITGTTSSISNPATGIWGHSDIGSGNLGAVPTTRNTINNVQIAGGQYGISIGALDSLDLSDNAHAAQTDNWVMTFIDFYGGTDVVPGTNPTVEGGHINSTNAVQQSIIQNARCRGMNKCVATYQNNGQLIIQNTNSSSSVIGSFPTFIYNDAELLGVPPMLINDQTEGGVMYAVHDSSCSSPSYKETWLNNQWGNTVLVDGCNHIAPSDAVDGSLLSGVSIVTNSASVRSEANTNAIGAGSSSAAYTTWVNAAGIPTWSTNAFRVGMTIASTSSPADIWQSQESALTACLVSPLPGTPQTIGTIVTSSDCMYDGTHYVTWIDLGPMTGGYVSGGGRRALGPGSDGTYLTTSPMYFRTDTGLIGGGPFFNFSMGVGGGFGTSNASAYNGIGAQYQLSSSQIVECTNATLPGGGVRPSDPTGYCLGLLINNLGFVGINETIPTHHLVVGGTIQAENKKGVMASGFFSASAQTALIATMAAISNGSMIVSVNGTPHTLNSMNFSTVATMANIATVINTAVNSALTGTTCTYVNGYFTIASPTTGASSSVSFATVGGTGTDVSSPLQMRSTQKGYTNPGATGQFMFPDGTTQTTAAGSGTFTTLSQDALSTATGGATTVVGINNTLLSSLATGLLVNTTTTGVPSVVAAPAGTVVGTTDTQALTNKTVDGVTPTVFGYLDPTSSVQTQLNSKGAGTVTAVSVATANGVSGSSSGGATPALTIALGAITPTSTNGVSSTTMAFMDATSSVQTQLNAKAASNASTTANGQTCALGSTCTVSGGTNTQTTNYTLVASDLGKLVIMNCSGACTVTLYGSPTAGYYGAIESIGSTVATVSLNSKNFNGASSVPVLNSFRPLEFWSDSTNYFGLSPLVAGSGISFTPASNGVTIALNLPSQYKTWTCQPGLGDGTNAMTAATYLQSECWNTTGVTVTLTGISCYTDNSGSSTLNAAGNTLGALLTGAVTCSSSLAAGTQSANVLLTNGDYIKATFVADGTSKQTTWVFTGTY